MLRVNSQSDADIYGALFALAKSISGHNDLEGLCRGLAQSLQRVVGFEYLGLMLHDPARNVMRRHVLTTTQPVPLEDFPALPIDEDPAGWVWSTQATLVISPVAAETRWPKFLERAGKIGLCSLSLVPLSIGERRIGVLGFGGRKVYEPAAAELSFLERVASEFAVTVDSFLMQQTIVRERDRLQVLFDITNALVSKLSREDLFAAISEQLSKIIAHDFAALILLEKEGSAQESDEA
jgi:formate hydrogenlyase transcriptional activator